MPEWWVLKWLLRWKKSSSEEAGDSGEPVNPENTLPYKSVCAFPGPLCPHILSLVLSWPSLGWRAGDSWPLKCFAYQATKSFGLWLGLNNRGTGERLADEGKGRSRVFSPLWSLNTLPSRLNLLCDTSSLQKTLLRFILLSGNFILLSSLGSSSNTHPLHPSSPGMALFFCWCPSGGYLIVTCWTLSKPFTWVANAYIKSHLLKILEVISLFLFRSWLIHRLSKF